MSKKENEGRFYFWFNKEEFTDKWFKDQLDVSVRNLDRRYTPELNFDLPIAKIFDGIARDENFEKQFISYLDDLLKKQSKAVSQIDEPEVQDLIEEIVSNISRFRQECEQIDFDEVTQINIEKLTEELREISCIIKEVAHQYRELISVSDKIRSPSGNLLVIKPG
ncbi:MAG: hypothetical protein IPG53_23455 [Ignavibacteriales bacterium]|nr:hypothetical protein [Ignavibacteriales bacterium]